MRAGRLGPTTRRRERAVEAGALDAAVQAMRAHPQVPDVQEEGIKLLVMCLLLDRLVLVNRRQIAMEAGALEAVEAAMQAHPQARGVQNRGCVAIFCLCHAEETIATFRSRGAGL